MAASEVEICMKALSRIGETAPLPSIPSGDISDVSNISAAAKACQLWYATCRDEVLRRVRWPFATRRQALAVVAGETRDSWDFVYGLPADCLQVRTITVEGTRNPRFDELPPHVIEARVSAGDVVGKLLLCDVEDAELVYTMRVENPAAFDPDFEAALVARLAASLARALVKGLEGARLARDCMEEYELAWRTAAAAALNEQHADPEPDGEILASRR